MKQITTHVEIEMEGLFTFYRRKHYKEDVVYIHSLIHTEKKEIFYFPGGPVVDCASTTGDTGSIHGEESSICHAELPQRKKK